MSSEGRTEGRETPKLNMEHGFIQSIIKNQVDRDEYDKEQRLLKVQSKISGSSRKERPKRAAMQMYVPPHLRAKTANDKDSSPKEDLEEKSTPMPAEVQMKLEFVRQDGEVRELNICEGEDLKKLVNSFGRANGLDLRLRDALYHRLSSALKERAS